MRALGDGGGGRAADQQASSCSQACPSGHERDRQELELQVALGGRSLATKGWAPPRWSHAYARARELCRAASAKSAACSRRCTGLLHFHHNQRRACTPARDRARASAPGRAAQDDVALRLVGPIGALGDARCSRADFGAALPHLRAVAAALRPRKHGLPPRLRYGTIRALQCLAFSWRWSLLYQGYPDQALGRSRERRSRWPVSSAIHTQPGVRPVRALPVPSVPRTSARESRAGRGADRARDRARLSALAGDGTVLPRLGAARRRARPSGHRRRCAEDLPRCGPRGPNITLPYSWPAGRGASARRASSAKRWRLLAEALDRVDETGERWFEAELHRLKGDAPAALSQARIRRGRSLLPQGHRGRPEPGRASVGAARRDQPRAAVARSGQARRGPRPARAGLRLVHRGLRHRRPEGRQGAARRAGVAPRGIPQGPT